MRSYPPDSPQAATRLVALALVADGHVSPTELAALDRAGGYGTLGLDEAGAHRVLQDLCEDAILTHAAHWPDVCVIDDEALDRMLDEVRSPLLRCQVLTLSHAVVAADGHVTEGESAVLGRALARWSGQPAGGR